MRTWKVIRWDDKPAEVQSVELMCKCGQEATVPVARGPTIIARIGMGLVFEPAGYVPPANFMPGEIQCRTCRRIYTDL